MEGEEVPGSSLQHTDTRELLQEEGRRETGRKGGKSDNFNRLPGNTTGQWMPGAQTSTALLISCVIWGTVRHYKAE